MDKWGQFDIPKKDQIIQTRQAKWLVQSLRDLQHWALATRWLRGFSCHAGQLVNTFCSAFQAHSFCMTVMRRLDSESGLQHLLLWGLRPGDGAFHLLSRLRGFEDPFALGDPELKNRMTSTGGLRKIAMKEKRQNYHGIPWTIRLSSWGLVCHFCRTPKWTQVGCWDHNDWRISSTAPWADMNFPGQINGFKEASFFIQYKGQNRWNGLPCSFSSPHRPHWHGLEWKLPGLLSNALWKLPKNPVIPGAFISLDCLRIHNCIQLFPIDLWRRFKRSDRFPPQLPVALLLLMIQWRQWLLAQHPASHQASCTESNSSRSQCRHRAHSDCFLPAELCE